MPRTTTSVTRRNWGPRKKYSLARSTIASNTTAGASTLGAQTETVIVASIAGQGKQKCKNFDIQLACMQQAGVSQALIYYALVYVPSGSNPGNISDAAATEFYTPASNVLAAGVYDCDEGTGFRIRTRLARNLNAGDQILLLTRSLAQAAGQVGARGVVSYVVAYN